MMTERECFNRIVRFQKPEWIPNYEMGVVGDTLKRWKGEEGMPRDATLGSLFGLDHIEDMQYLVYGPIPGVPDSTRWPGITMEDGTSVFMRDAWGSETVHMKDEEHADGAHRLVRPGIRDRADWEKLKGQFRPDEPLRYPDHWDEDNWQQRVARWKDREHVVMLRMPSMVGGIKELMGFENYCLALMGEPELIEEIMETQTQLALGMLGRAFDEVEFDGIHFWEDIGFRNGPILDPAIFERIASPRYKRLADFFRSKGGYTVSVDSDGDIRKLIPGWIKGGVTHIWPLEPFSGMDVVALRREYGHAFSMRGGVDKFVIGKGKDAIRRELDRVYPVVQDGGYIPHLDHQISGVRFEDYCYYMEEKKKMLGDR
jgi:uroporphyrinogen decarboxylase